MDFHVDLGWAAHAKHASLLDEARDASLARLVLGEVGTLVVPLFIEGGYAKTPAQARAAYDATFASVSSLFRREGKGVIGAPLSRESRKIRIRISFEGSDGFSDSPDAAVAWLRRGACLFGLVHSRTNALGGASQDPDRKKRLVGLTATGKGLAERLVQEGALLDVAHASDRTFDDLAAIAERAGAPLVDSHTGVRALVAIDRNLDDARIVRVARSGGLVALSLHSGHVSSRPGEQASLSDYVAHIEHVRRLVGASHVGIGSDLEGAIQLPRDVPGAAVWPTLGSELARRGWTTDELGALFHGNADRVFGWSEAHGCGRDR